MSAHHPSRPRQLGVRIQRYLTCSKRRQRQRGRAADDALTSRLHRAGVGTGVDMMIHVQQSHRLMRSIGAVIALTSRPPRNPLLQPNRSAVSITVRGVATARHLCLQRHQPSSSSRSLKRSSQTLWNLRFSVWPRLPGTKLLQLCFHSKQLLRWKCNEQLHFWKLRHRKRSQQMLQ